MNKLIELEKHYGASLYDPAPIVFNRGEGVYLWDTQGRGYLDMISAYSAVSHGHAHPRLIQVLKEQVDRLAVTSRISHTDALGPYLEKACTLTKQAKAIPMNTGVEAVETALKAARKWAYKVKGVSENQAEVIVCSGNFHGRTICVVSFSAEENYRKDFGPYTPGFKTVPYGDAQALKAAITENTAAFLVEPIQGENGIVIPPTGYLAECAKICQQHDVLLIADEIQTGLGRTGKFLACEHDNVQPDGLILGKALGGGLLPASLFLARNDVMNVFHPGEHGSTFGGNPLSAVVAHEALQIILDEELSERSAKLGAYLLDSLKTHLVDHPAIKDIRGCGLFVGIEIKPKLSSAKSICLKLIENGLLTRETHETIIRLAPPLVITKGQINDALSILLKVMKEF